MAVLFYILCIVNRYIEKRYNIVGDKNDKENG